MTKVFPLRDLIIYCDRVSDAATLLAKRLNARRCVANPRHKLRRTDGSLIINYGSSVAPNWIQSLKTVVLNSPAAVAASISKVKSYERFKEAGIPTIEFTVSLAQAKEWCSGGHRVLGRRDGLSGGAGINFFEPGTGDSISPCDFYARYFKKTHEYRVHVVKARVIDITQKKLAVAQTAVGDGSGGDNRTLHQRVVRSLDNGWVHAHEALHLPDEIRQLVEKASIDAVACLGLDFGAVDIIAQFGKKNPSKFIQMAVLEVNTAPGLGNEVTIKAYEDAFKGIYTTTSIARALPRVVRKPKRVRKLVKVRIKTRKGNVVWRDRYRYITE